jgi:hypothetical protein
LFPNGAFENTFAHTGAETARKIKKKTLILNCRLEMNITIVGSVNLKAYEYTCNKQCKKFSDV